MNGVIDTPIYDNSRVKIILILIFLVVVLIVITSLFIFVKPLSERRETKPNNLITTTSLASSTSIPTTINTAVPTIVSEENNTFLLQYPNESSTIQIQTKLIRIIYKNLNFSVEVFTLPTPELASQYMNSEVLPVLRNNPNMTGESDVSLNGFSGKKYIIENLGRIVLNKDETILFCWSEESTVVDVEFVCNSFIEERMI